MEFSLGSIRGVTINSWGNSSTAPRDQRPPPKKGELNPGTKKKPPLTDGGATKKTIKPIPPGPQTPIIPKKGNPLLPKDGGAKAGAIDKTVDHAKYDGYLTERFKALGTLFREGGFHKATGAPMDHLILSSNGQKIEQAFPYGSMAKQGGSFPFLLHVVKGHPYLKATKITKEQALDQMILDLKSLREYQKRAEGKEVKGGHFPWMDYGKDGKRSRNGYGNKNFVPILDTALGKQALEANVGAFIEAEKGSKEAQVRDLSLEIIKNQTWAPFIEPKTGMLAGAWNFDTNSREGIPGSKLLWTEWAVAYRDAYLHGEISKASWLKLSNNTFLYNAPKIGPIDVPQLSIFSAHEAWWLLYSHEDIMASKLAPLYRNLLYLHAKNARDNNRPGFCTTCYGPKNDYPQTGLAMDGVTLLGKVDQSNLAVPYGTGLLGLVDDDAAGWLPYNLKQLGMKNRFGWAASFSRTSGASTVVGADETWVAAVAAMEAYNKRKNIDGVNDWINAYYKKYQAKSRADLIASLDAQADVILARLKKDSSRRARVVAAGLPAEKADGFLTITDDTLFRTPELKDFSVSPVNSGTAFGKEIRVSGRIHSTGKWDAVRVTTSKQPYASWKNKATQPWVSKDGEVYGEYSFKNVEGSNFAYITINLDTALPFASARPGQKVRSIKSASLWVPADSEEYWQVAPSNNGQELTEPRIAVDTLKGELSKDKKWRRVVVPVFLKDDVISKETPGLKITFSTDNRYGKPDKKSGIYSGVFHFKDLRFHEESADVISARKEDGPSGIKTLPTKVKPPVVPKDPDRKDPPVDPMPEKGGKTTELGKIPGFEGRRVFFSQIDAESKKQGKTGLADNEAFKTTVDEKGVLHVPQGDNQWAGSGSPAVRLPGKNKGVQYVYFYVRAPKGKAEFRLRMDGYIKGSQKINVNSDEWELREVEITEDTDEMTYFAVQRIKHGSVEIVGFHVTKERKKKPEEKKKDEGEKRGALPTKRGKTFAELEAEAQIHRQLVGRNFLPTFARTEARADKTMEAVQENYDFMVGKIETPGAFEYEDRARFEERLRSMLDVARDSDHADHEAALKLYLSLFHLKPDFDAHNLAELPEPNAEKATKTEVKAWSKRYEDRNNFAQPYYFLYETAARLLIERLPPGRTAFAPYQVLVNQEKDKAIASKNDAHAEKMLQAFALLLNDRTISEDSAEVLRQVSIALIRGRGRFKQGSDRRLALNKSILEGFHNRLTKGSKKSQKLFLRDMNLAISSSGDAGEAFLGYLEGIAVPKNNKATVVLRKIEKARADSESRAVLAEETFQNAVAALKNETTRSSAILRLALRRDRASEATQALINAISDDTQLQTIDVPIAEALAELQVLDALSVALLASTTAHKSVTLLHAIGLIGSAASSIRAELGAV